MIYVFPDPQAPIRQGDIFRCIPRVDLNLSALPVLSDPALRQVEALDWLTVCHKAETTRALATIRPVCAIVITQDCDVLRARDIALCEIDRFENVYPSAKGAAHPKKTMSLITEHARKHLKWFYLPPEPRVDFTAPMAADFQSVLRVSRAYLEQNTVGLRLARLNDLADEHFRERLAEYFRRYPYDEWYPLDKAEFEEYRRSKPEPIQPYPWQE
ncbi:MAG: hypothetical protein WBV59_25825 [Anaerolineae bacterium]